MDALGALDKSYWRVRRTDDLAQSLCSICHSCVRNPSLSTVVTMCDSGFWLRGMGRNTSTCHLGDISPFRRWREPSEWPDWDPYCSPGTEATWVGEGPCVHWGSRRMENICRLSTTPWSGDMAATTLAQTDKWGGICKCVVVTQWPVVAELRGVSNIHECNLSVVSNYR